MAVEENENPSLSGTRQSPGDAAFERLARREAIKARDEGADPPSAGPAPRSEPAAEIAGDTAPAATLQPDSDAGTVREAVASSRPPSEEPEPAAAEAVVPGASVDPVLAVAAAFGFEILPPEPEPARPLPIAAQAAAPGPQASRPDAPPMASLPPGQPVPTAVSRAALPIAAAAAKAPPPGRDVRAPAPIPVMPAKPIPASTAAKAAESPRATPPAPKPASPAPGPRARSRGPVPKASPVTTPTAKAPQPQAEAAIPAPPARRAVAKPADATAARLEAALLDQLKSLEETLVDDLPPTPAKLPRAEPLRSSDAASEAPAADFAPKRSVFAPDPVRQRTYVDLRNPPPEPEPEMAGDAPWRKYLAEPPRRSAPVRSPARAPSPRPAAARAEVAASVEEYKAEVRERRRGVRAMTAAAVLGLGVGLGLIVLIRPFAGSGETTVAATAPDAPAVVAAASPATEAPAPAPADTAPRPADGTLAALMSDAPLSQSAPAGPAVISEPGTVVAEVEPAAASAAPDPVAVAATPAPAERPIVIRPPPGEARVAERVPDQVTVQSRALSYGPAIPSFDPVRESLLEDEARGDPAPEAKAPAAGRRAPAVTEAAVPADVRPGRATINSFVNMRARPDNAAPIVAILADGLSVKVVGCDYWCEIEAGGKRGYVFKKFLSR
jgi:hypothetical protein